MKASKIPPRLLYARGPSVVGRTMAEAAAETSDAFNITFEGDCFACLTYSKTGIFEMLDSKNQLQSLHDSMELTLLYDSGTQNVTVLAGGTQKEVSITCVLDTLYNMHTEGIDVFGELCLGQKTK